MAEENLNNIENKNTDNNNNNNRNIQRRPKVNRPNIPDNEQTLNKKPNIQLKKDITPESRLKQPQQESQLIQKKPLGPKPKHQGGLLISVVIPLFNEEESLPELSLALESELKKLVGSRWEVIYIDDGSTDGSFNVIRTINERNRNFKCIRFRTNYGKSTALNIGFKEASGKIIITMDADLQDDPAEIKNLIAKMKEGYDLVSGWKKKRYDPINKTIPSKFFNFVTSMMSGVKLHDFNCGLKAYRKECAKSLNVYGEMHRYLPALAHWDGFSVTEIPVQHHPRRYGKTKFGASRFIKGFLDLLTVVFTTRYLKRPLHFFGVVGSILTLTGFSINLYLLIEWILGITYLSNRPLALFGIALIIVGVQSISLGLIGEMIVKNSVDKINISIKEKIN